MGRSANVVALVVAATAFAFGGEPPVPESLPGGETILTERSLWRTNIYHRYPTVLAADGKLERRRVVWYWGAFKAEPLPKPHQLSIFKPEYNAAPPEGWTAPDFDDFSWARCRFPLPVHHLPNMGINYDTGLIVARGKFEVKDPSAAANLRLAIEYSGGVVVFVNGREASRGHMPEGKIAPDSLAEAYPPEAVSTPDGKPLKANDQKNRDRVELRRRRLQVDIPKGLLRKGVNVIAIANHASPVRDLVFKLGNTDAGWPPIGLLSVRLSAPARGMATPNVARPGGIQVWNCAADETLSVSDYGDPCEPLRPIAIDAAPNGVFSGRLMVSSGAPIRGLKVEVSDLAFAGNGPAIPAAAVRVRWAEPVEGMPDGSDQWVPNGRFHSLLDKVPAEIPVAALPAERSPGAVAALWFTVRVPKDARPGRYEGAATVSADGLGTVKVPVHLTVHGWPVPDPKDWVMKNFGIPSFDSLVNRYGVVRWSDRHFEMIARSMALMAEVNSRQAWADLCINYSADNAGDCSNQESLVRWIRQPDGTYRHDFSVFDRYLDTVARTVGKPLPMRVNCWGEWFKPGNQTKFDWLPSSPRYVTLLDPATGKLDRLEMPSPESPDFIPFWKPVLDEVRKKIEARGWRDVTSFGHNSYCHQPNVLLVDALHAIWPDAKYSYTAHNGALPDHPKKAFFYGTDRNKVALPVFTADCVWTSPPASQRGYTRLLQQPPRYGYWCFSFRGTRLGRHSLAVIRDISEEEARRGLNGWSDFGVDFFLWKGPKGWTGPVGNGRGTGGPGCGILSLLGPGPDGPVASEAYEMFREGSQITEAVLFLQKAVDGGKLPPDLAQRINRELDLRGAAAFWRGVVVGGCAEADARVLALAAEAARETAGK
ncbi:MAG: DUF6067 family protein [Planctomycetota bacterium]|nr:DUF6067 family protein [Planctomycetota bacterium]